MESHAPALLLAGLAVAASIAAAETLLPRVEGQWWTIATSPDLGPLTAPGQQPVDFALWQAADGAWQLWSCIRHTKAPGKSRLFHRWEGAQLTDRDWAPKGIAMQAEPTLGETPGGLQAPHVFRDGARYLMAYGDWEHICLAESADGKSFARIVRPDGTTGMFTEGPGNNTRDPMVLRIGERWHCYYTAYPDRKGAVYCRTSPDLKHWSASRVVAFGGRAGTDPFSAECPFVVELSPGSFYLFRTQRYGAKAQTSVYHSRDPLDFGVDNDAEHFLTTLPIAAPELVHHEGRWYIAALLPSLKGIQLARLAWVPRERHP
mgnify:CR=1 FL=1